MGDLKRTLSFSRRGGARTTWDTDLLLPVPEECAAHESWCRCDFDDDTIVGDDDAEEQAALEEELDKELQCQLLASWAATLPEEGCVIVSPTSGGPSDNAPSTDNLVEWPALGKNSIGSDWDLCSEASSLASSWALLDEFELVGGDAQMPVGAPLSRGSFAEALQRGAAKRGETSRASPPSVGPAWPTSPQVRPQAASEEDKEDCQVFDEKDGRGGRWMRTQKGTRSIKQRKRVESAICRRLSQKHG